MWDERSPGRAHGGIPPGEPSQSRDNPLTLALGLWSTTAVLSGWLSSSLFATTLAASPTLVADSQATQQPTLSAADAAARARKHRLRGFGWAIAGTGGLLTTTILQSRASRGDVPCIDLRSGQRACSQSEGPAGSALHAAGLSTFVVGSAGMAFAFGRAHAFDAVLEGRRVRSAKLGLIVGGVVVAASQAFFAAGLKMAAAGKDCETESCRFRTRNQQYALMDLGAMGTALGAGIGAFVLGRQFQSRRLAELSVMPAVSRSHSGASISGRF